MYYHLFNISLVEMSPTSQSGGHIPNSVEVLTFTECNPNGLHKGYEGSEAA